MKRFSFVIALLGLFTMISADQLTAADNYRGHQPPRHGNQGYRYGGHQSQASTFSGGLQYSANRHPSRQTYYRSAGHGSTVYVAPSFGHGTVRRGFGHQGYRSNRHGGQLQIATPNFGLRIGH